MSKTKLRNIGIVIKQKIPEANELALLLAENLKSRGIKVLFAAESQDVCSLAMGTACASREELVEKCDLILILGGDGTFISMARRMVNRSVPLMGINMGTLGFLTEVKKTEALTMLNRVLAGTFKLSEHVLLESILMRGGKEIARMVVSNDVVVHKAAIARIIELETSINDNLVTTMRSDGLIVSTPMGSTAYSLAAGGPVIEPSVPALVITPICPHSLTLRPIVVDNHARISIKVRNSTESVVTWDGQTSHSLQLGDDILVRKYYKHNLQVIHSNDRNYYGVLREKLKYGYRD